AGFFGDTILVNGAPWPHAEVAAVRYRLRILNASSARPYLLRLDPPPAGGGGIVQIGSELGLLPRPVHPDELMVGPAARVGGGGGSTWWSTSGAIRSGRRSSCATRSARAGPRR